MFNFLMFSLLFIGISLIVVILMQPSKSDALSGLIQGSNTQTYFKNNSKLRTKESILEKLTSILFVLFCINTILINLI